LFAIACNVKTAGKREIRKRQGPLTERRKKERSGGRGSSDCKFEKTDEGKKAGRVESGGLSRTPIRTALGGIIKSHNGKWKLTWPSRQENPGGNGARKKESDFF